MDASDMAREDGPAMAGPATATTDRTVAVRRTPDEWQLIDEKIAEILQKESQEKPGRPITKKEAMAELKALGLDVTPKQYSTRTAKGNLRRNTSRELAMGELRRLRSIPLVPLDQEDDHVLSASVQRYIKRHKLQLSCPLSGNTNERQLLVDIRGYVLESFGHQKWMAVSPEALINSTPHTQVEKAALNALRRNIVIGIDKSPEPTLRQTRESTIHFNLALRCVEQLVCGTYHDHIPNLVRLLTDLHRAGFGTVATAILERIRASTERLDAVNDKRHALFVKFSRMDLGQVLELEDAIQTLFKKLFALRIGDDSYNTFVMRMDHARRRLLQDPQAPLESYLPNLDELDRKFGPNERRSMDVILLQVEVLLSRHCLAEAESRAQLLLSRARACTHDEWLSKYYLTGGTFLMGKILATERNFPQASASLLEFLELERRFQTMCSGYIFEPERARAWQLLREFPSTPHQEGQTQVWADHLKQEDTYMEVLEGWTLI